MQLSEFPQAIYDTQLGLLRAESNLQELQQSIAAIKNQIECQIVFDTSFKNDAQRSCKKLELLAQNTTYIELEEQLKTVQLRQRAYQTEIEFLRNRFSIAKLEKRQAIARLEAQTSE